MKRPAGLSVVKRMPFYACDDKGRVLTMLNCGICGRVGAFSITKLADGRWAGPCCGGDAVRPPIDLPSTSKVWRLQPGRLAAVLDRLSRRRSLTIEESVMLERALRMQDKGADTAGRKRPPGVNRMLARAGKKKLIG